MSLFAVLVAPLPSSQTLPEFRNVLPKGFDYHRKLIDEGVILHSWIRVGMQGGLNIYDVESHEQLLAALYANPISQHLQFEIIPLARRDSFDPSEWGEDATHPSTNAS
ncbi:muconolactone Delta-isomerase family protein [Saccharopolyspora phatthalungensis]|uniref:Muconolactone delta-isomerase n=1 Tax=Saccharopolyspora phatthalungensis TaxID=664693 RepID=A0A840QA81_9PSEU|nr:muconolactone Delta-isomerase family protein [Saccharopolyspora phatthalungensis]MBB5156857.1 muconolactone delta-isomerase [Saccharopolyspora phatthalungensis]